MIQFYARWGSPAILRYVRDASLSTKAIVIGKLAATMRHMDSIENVHKELAVRTGQAVKTELNENLQEFLGEEHLGSATR